MLSEHEHEHVATVAGVPVSAGDHICAFYRGRSERQALMVSFLREGIGAGDTCICIAPRGERGDIESAVAVDDAGNGEGPVGELQMEDFESSYLRSGSFVGSHMLAFWQAWAHDTFEVKRRDFARGVTDMSWAEEVATTPVLDDVLAYEVQATRFARSYPQVALCLYDLNLYGGNVIFPVMKVHPKVLFSGILLENPYYLDPDEVLTG
jgi:hypothetical protein